MSLSVDGGEIKKSTKINLHSREEKKCDGVLSLHRSKNRSSSQFIYNHYQNPIYFLPDSGVDAKETGGSATFGSRDYPNRRGGDGRPL